MRFGGFDVDSRASGSEAGGTLVAIQRSEIVAADGRPEFQTRQPGYCALARDLFGDDAIRVWSSHAKFAIFSGGRFDVLYLTSANMNQNKRLENHTVVAGGDLPERYLDMIEELFDIQASGAAFGPGQKTARRDMQTIYGARARS